MATGAFFEPKALCGSTSGRSAADCGAGGREAAFATTTDGGIIGGSEAAWELTLSGGDCANGWADGKAGSGVLCKDGRNRAHKPSKPTLIIAARIRRRFTRSSKVARAILPCGRRLQNSTAKRREGKSRCGLKFTGATRNIPTAKLSKVGCWRNRKRCEIEILVNNN